MNNNTKTPIILSPATKETISLLNFVIKELKTGKRYVKDINWTAVCDMREDQDNQLTFTININEENSKRLGKQLKKLSKGLRNS